jgi:hypothetical protein
MHQPKFAWTDYFSGNAETTLYSVEYNSIQTPSGSSVYVSNCLFNKVSSTSDGGALSCTSASYLLVESSSFFSCKTSGSNGGAIYISNTNSGQCVLYGVCGNDCYSTYTSRYSRGQFARINVKDDASFKNCVNYSSITRCVNVISVSAYALSLYYGKIYSTSVNISMVKCCYHSIIYFNPFIDSDSITCSLLYSSFTDSYAFGHCCISSERDAKNEIKCCNILRNRHASSSYGMIYVPGNWMIEDCCILENTATNIFYIWTSSTLTLSNCTVDSTTNNGKLKIQNTVTKSFILGLNHISTRNCHSECDSAGTLTAIPHVSHTTKKENCYTPSHCHARIRDFFSLHCLFIVTFIHSYPS